MKWICKICNSNVDKIKEVDTATGVVKGNCPKCKTLTILVPVLKN